MSALLKLAFEGLSRTGAAALLRPWTQGEGVIFCLHHVLPQEGKSSFQPNANLETTPAFLDAALSMLRQEGYDFLSLDQALARIGNGQTGAGRPFAVFTLDDGYRDNAQHGLPIFEKHNCPFTVYVAPGLVEGTTEMWWRALEHIITRQAELDVTVKGEHFRLKTSSDSEKWQAWNALLPRVQNLPEHEQRHWIRQESARVALDLPKLCHDAVMSWAELRRFASHPLVTIGAHSLNHYALSRLDETEARREIVASGERLAQELGKPVRHFAFPYGNVAHAGPREFHLAKQAGYASAVTTRMGAVFPEHAQHLQALPRVMVSSKYAELRWLKVLASGLPGRLANRGARLNVA